MAVNYDPAYFSLIAKAMKLRNEDQVEKRPVKNVVVHTMLCAQEVELLIREFNPCKYQKLNATEWIQQIETLARVHKWDDAQVILYATMRLRGVAKIWYEYALETITGWEDFKTQLQENFPRKLDVADIHAKLVAKKRHSTEAIEEYFHSTVKLAKKAKLHDKSIKEYLIRGLNEPKHQMILSAIESSSLTELLLHMQRLEKDSSSDADEKKSEGGSSKQKSREESSREKSSAASSLSRRLSERNESKREYRSSSERSENRPRLSDRREYSQRSSEKNRSDDRSPRRREDYEKSSRHSPDRRQSSRDSSRHSEHSSDKEYRNRSMVQEEIMCWDCGKKGHFFRDCPITKARELKKKGQSED